MSTDTREKLSEARYFLGYMKKNQSDRDAFKYNLNVFLAASRSVTFIMQTEFCKVPGFKEWYAKKQSEMQRDETMRLLNDKRVMTIHQQPVRPYAHVNMGIMEHITISESVLIINTGADGTIERRESKPTSPPAPAKSEVTIEWRWYFDELPEKDVVVLCKEHMVKLETLVAECESLFTS